MAQAINVDRRRILGAGLALVAAAAAPKARAQAVSFGPLKQIDAGVLNVGYAETGPANGTPVLLLHGWPYDVHTYVDVAPLLASAGHRVIRATLRGSFGRPPRRSGISMTLRSIGRRLPSTIRITSPFRFTTIGGASQPPPADYFLFRVDGISWTKPGNADGRPFWTRPRKVRFARRFRVERAWRQSLDECLVVLGPVPEVPQPANNDGRAGISMRMRLDDGIRRDSQLDRVQARFRRVAEQHARRDGRQS